MGLDITALRVVEFAHEERQACPSPDEKWGDCPHRYVHYCDQESWRKRLGSLKLGYYAPGYEDTYPDDAMAFHAGSYGGYNAWREWLSWAFIGVAPRTVWDNPITYSDAPFYELVDFSDCEGTLGPEVCAALADDFATYTPSCWVDRYVEKYREWERAFKLAASTGAVIFH